MHRPPTSKGVFISQFLKCLHFGILPLNKTKMILFFLPKHAVQINCPNMFGMNIFLVIQWVSQTINRSGTYSPKNKASVSQQLQTSQHSNLPRSLTMPLCHQEQPHPLRHPSLHTISRKKICLPFAQSGIPSVHAISSSTSCNNNLKNNLDVQFPLLLSWGLCWCLVNHSQ